MKKAILTLVFVTASKLFFGQTINGGFNTPIDTIKSSSGKEITVHLKVKLDKDVQSTYKNFKISVSLIADKSNLQSSNIFFSQKINTVKELSDSVIVDIPVKLIRDTLRDRIAFIQLSMQKEDGTAIEINSNYVKVKQLYILPFKTSEKPDFEPLIFIGSNFDPLDGLQPKNLYAKFNFFWKLDKRNYIQMGLAKNRLFSPSDSIKNVPLSETYQSKKNFQDTSISYVSGKYTKIINQKIEPLTVYLEYHRKLDFFEAPTSMFVTLGTEFGLFKTTVTNTRNDMISDTVVYKISKAPKFVLNPYQAQTVVTRPNYLIYTGFMFIYDTDELNVKAQMLGGMNQYYYIDVDQFVIARSAFTELKINLVVKKGGFGVGVDVLTRAKTNPVIGLTLSKVVDIKDFKSLFSTVSTTK